jgi:hypothetical protein
MRLPHPAISAAFHLALGSAFVYGLWNSSVGFGGSTAAVALISVLAVGAQLGAGYAIGRWWALLLPYALVLLAVPAGFPPGGEREPLAIWLVQAWLATPEALLMVPGILARKLRDGPGPRSS